MIPARAAPHVTGQILVRGASKPCLCRTARCGETGGLRTEHGSTAPAISLADGGCLAAWSMRTCISPCSARLGVLALRDAGTRGAENGANRPANLDCNAPAA